MTNTDDPARAAETNMNPAAQTGEDKGKIRKPQQTDATMAEKDLARGSEMAAHNRR